MGFLDDLKRQAEAAKASQSTDGEALARNAGLADIACKTVSAYFSTLVQQLNVLRPRTKVSYRLDRGLTFNDLQLADFRTDTRHKRLRGVEAYDHVVLRWRMTTGTKHTLSKNFLPEIKGLESRLRQGGVRFEMEEIRNPENSKLQEMRYKFVADFNATVLITPDHDLGRVRFELVNLGGLETITVNFAAFEISAARLDELARWIMGEPNEFLKNGQNLRIVEA